MTDYSSEDFWKGAPEGAERYFPGSGEWYKRDNGALMVWCGNRLRWYQSVCSHRESMAVSRPAPPWSGDGLPPVGTFVRITDDGSLYYGSNESGEVIAHVEDCAVVRMSYGLGCFTARYLEAIKTPAQIAAEEREAAIEAMWRIYWQPSATSAKQALGLLWDAGLRFPEGDDK